MDQKEVKVQVSVFVREASLLGSTALLAAPRHFPVVLHISDGVSKVLNQNRALGAAKSAAAPQGNVPPLRHKITHF